MGYGIRVLVRGPRACFTRPELRAERVSYAAMTPSAARGVLDAVYWKPAFKWRVDSIEVLNEIRYGTVVRNEVGGKLPYAAARSLALGEGGAPLLEDAQADRQQRCTTYLRDVAYVVAAHFEETASAGPRDGSAKHYAIALRRLRAGQCFQMPCLGLREFPAYVELLEEGRPAPRGFYAGSGEVDLGRMLLGIDHDGTGAASFFRAVMRDGVIAVPGEATGR